ncbi:MAG TPA: hypothetical protein VMU11_01945 [Verrucomicrobiae bacterium]|nr:hypothetical protein [Verrucomicrobiae bacterium]
MSRLPDDFDPRLVKQPPPPDDDGPPTRELKPIRPATPRHPAAKLDLDRAEEILDLPPPSSRRPPSA